MKPVDSSIPSMLKGQVLSMVKGCFGPMDDQEAQAIMDASGWLTLRGGQTLFSPDDPAEEIFLLIHGKMKATQQNEGEVQVIGEIQPGELIGEMAIISERKRKLNVVAARDSHLISIHRDTFKELFFKFPGLGWNISQLLISRFEQKPRPRHPSHLKNIVLLPCSEKVDVDWIIRELLALALNKSIAIAKKEIYSHEDQGEEHSMSVAINDHLEQENDLVIYPAELQDGSWNEFCLRQADEIVLITDGQTPIPKDRIKKILRKKNRLTLHSVMVIHYPNVESLSFPKLTDHHYSHYIFHVRKDNAEDLARWKRHLFDESIALVLAGGGARAMSHLGVWRALCENDVPIDRVSGTSMGAFIGGLIALGHGPESVHEIVKDIAYSRPSRDLNPIPYSSIIRGKNLNKALGKHYRGKLIEDCIIPFCCVSTNLTKVGPTYHTSGDMFTAIRASGSLPGVVPPVPIHRQWHVDGGLVDNFPVDDAIRWGARTIIGASIDPGENPGASYDHIPTMRDQLWNGLFKRNKEQPLPTLMETVLLSSTAYSHSKQVDMEDKVDCLIRPRIKGVGLMDWEAFDRVVEQGYTEAKRILEKTNLFD